MQVVGGGGVTNSRLPWLHLNLYPMFIVCLLSAFLTIGNVHAMFLHVPIFSRLGSTGPIVIEKLKEGHEGEKWVTIFRYS